MRDALGANDRIGARPVIDNNGLTQYLSPSFWTISGVAGNVIHLSGMNYTATFSGRCSLALNVPNSGATTEQHRAGVYSCRLDPLGFCLQVTELGKSRGLFYQWNGGFGYYFEQAHTQRSQDGVLTCWVSNNGEPSRNRSVCAENPWQTRAVNNYEFAPGFPVEAKSVSAGSINFTVRVPDAVNVGCWVTTTLGVDLSTTPTVSLNGPYVRRDTLLGGLASGTQYFWTCKSIDNAYVARGNLVIQ